MNDIDFENTETVVDNILSLLVEVNSIDFQNMNRDERDFVFSQIKKLIGSMAKILLRYESKY